MGAARARRLARATTPRAQALASPDGRAAGAGEGSADLASRSLRLLAAGGTRRLLRGELAERSPRSRAYGGCSTPTISPHTSRLGGTDRHRRTAATESASCRRTGRGSPRCWRSTCSSVSIPPRWPTTRRVRTCRSKPSSSPSPIATATSPIPSTPPCPSPRCSKDYAQGARRSSTASARASASIPASRGDTVYLTAADGAGNVVSLINSLFIGFGSGIGCGDTGIMLQNRGFGFSLDPEPPELHRARQAAVPHHHPGHDAARGRPDRVRRDGRRHAAAGTRAWWSNLVDAG